MRPGLSRCETAMGGKSAEESVACESRKVEELAPARALLQRCEGRGKKPGALPHEHGWSLRERSASSNDVRLTPSLASRLYALPAPLVWNVLTFWASARDPDY